MNDLNSWDKTDSQNLNLSVGLIWTTKCIDLYLENEWSEFMGQDGFAESELNCWFNMEREMY